MSTILYYSKFCENCNGYSNYPWSFQWMLQQERVMEIHQYLKDHTEIVEWVAIDDMQLGRDDDERTWGLRNFVHTPKGMEGIKQCGKKEKILEYLL